MKQFKIIKTYKRNKLIIKHKAEQKIKNILELMNGKEVSWFGLIQPTRKNFILSDIVIPPQENSATLVTTKDDEYPQWFFENITKPNLTSQIRLHGHTHPNMSVTPSGIDDNQFQTLLKEVDFMIQFIINEKQDIHCVIYNSKEKTQEALEVVWQEKEKLKEELFYKMNAPQHKTTTISNYGQYTNPQISYYDDLADYRNTYKFSSKKNPKTKEEEKDQNLKTPSLKYLAKRYIEAVENINITYGDIDKIFKDENIKDIDQLESYLANRLSTPKMMVSSDLIMLSTDEDNFDMMWGIY